MAETIESFVAKLQAEGVQAGEQAADELRQKAAQEAERIAAEASKQAEKVLADARTEAENILARSKTELDLAARDVILRLREALGKAISAALTRGTREKLTDVDFLGKALHEIVMLYAKAEHDGTRTMRINVPEDLREKLAAWALTEIGRERAEGLAGSIELVGTLKEAGFEYTVGGATVEVTLSSVVESLCEMVSPALREILAGTAEREK